MRIAWARFTRALRGSGAEARREGLGGAVAPRAALLELETALKALAAPEQIADDGLPMGQYPDDPDQVPTWWTLAEGWHQDWGKRYTAPPTRRAYEAALAEITARVEAAPGGTLFDALPADQSAERFLAYLQGEIGDDQESVMFTSDELTEVYADWCRNVEHRHPSSENFMRAALKRMDGVDSKQRRVPDAGRERRVWTFTIFRTETVETAQPLRKVA